MDEIAKKIYSAAFWASFIAGLILSIYYRFSNLELTITQLFIKYWVFYLAWGTLTILFCVGVRSTDG